VVTLSASGAGGATMTGNQSCGDSDKLLQAAQLATECASGDECLVLF
jgi:hypothetical protein